MMMIMMMLYFQAPMALFVLVSKDRWIQIMYMYITKKNCYHCNHLISFGNHILSWVTMRMIYFQALMALFVLASKDGWVQIMYTGLDAVGVDQQVSWCCHSNSHIVSFSFGTLQFS